MRLASVEVGGRLGIAAIVNEQECRVHFSNNERAALDLGLLLKQGQDAFVRALDALAEAPVIPQSSLRFLPPIPKPDKIICVGMNYRGHIEEVGMKMPEHPEVFVRFAETLVGHGAPIVRPKVSIQLDYEGELAVIIGKGGRGIKAKDALSHVAGYSVFNDASIRDYQLRSPLFTTGKNFDATGAFGPTLVTPDELPKGAAGLALRTMLNGKTVQESNTNDLVFDVAALIESISEFTTLRPGDVIITGTPAGVGIARKPQLWMKPGDVCSVEIEQIGTLTSPIIAET